MTVNNKSFGIYNLFLFHIGETNVYNCCDTEAQELKKKIKVAKRVTLTLQFWRKLELLSQL